MDVVEAKKQKRTLERFFRSCSVSCGAYEHMRFRLIWHIESLFIFIFNFVIERNLASNVHGYAYWENGQMCSKFLQTYLVVDDHLTNAYNICGEFFSRFLIVVINK